MRVGDGYLLRQLLRMTPWIMIGFWIPACEEPTPQDPATKGEEMIVTADPEQPVPGFFWAIERDLAAMARPGRSRPLALDLDYLSHQKIRLLIALTEEALSEQETASE